MEIQICTYNNVSRYKINFKVKNTPYLELQIFLTKKWELNILSALGGIIYLMICILSHYLIQKIDQKFLNNFYFELQGNIQIQNAEIHYFERFHVSKLAK